MASLSSINCTRGRNVRRRYWCK